jgi:hypothetical protein
MKRARATLVLGAVGATCFVLGSTGIGSAARNLVLPPNSVGAAQLRNGSVSEVKVRAGSLTAAAFKHGALPRGPAGPAGPAGPTGAAGSTATLGLAFVSGESDFDATTQKTATASCPAGKRAISWAFRIQLTSANNPAAAPAITGITPIDVDPSTGQLPGAYAVAAEAGGSYTDPWKLFAYATCENPS